MHFICSMMKVLSAGRPAGPKPRAERCFWLKKGHPCGCSLDAENESRTCIVFPEEATRVYAQPRTGSMQHCPAVTVSFTVQKTRPPDRAALRVEGRCFNNLALSSPLHTPDVANAVQSLPVTCMCVSLLLLYFCSWQGLTAGSWIANLVAACAAVFSSARTAFSDQVNFHICT